jgi:hypothetical protein
MAKTPDDILGKRLVRMDLKWTNKYNRTPSSGLFLVFDDGTYYEFYTCKGYLEPSAFIPANKHPVEDPRLVHYTLRDAARWTPPAKSSGSTPATKT